MDLASVTATGDRRATSALLEALAIARSPDEAGRLRRALAVIGDPRAIEPLKALASRPGTPGWILDATFDLIFSFIDPNGDWSRAIWDERPDLRVHQVDHLTDGLAGFVLDHVTECADPSALRGWDWDGHAAAGFAALCNRWIVDADPRRRWFALQNAYWNEPYELLPALTAALADPDREIADRAAYALWCFPCVAATRALDGAPHELPEREWSLEVNQAALSEVQALARGTSCEAHIGRWLSPVQHLLEVDNESGDDASDERMTPSAEIPALAELDRDLDDPDAPSVRLHQALRTADVAAVAEGERPRWSERFRHHADPEVRKCAVRWLLAWGCTETVLAFTNDPCGFVRWAAVRGLQNVDTVHALAEPCWRLVLDARGSASLAADALRAWDRHTPPAGRSEHLTRARTSPSISVRCAALDLLGRHGLIEHVAACWVPRPGESVAEVVAWLNACVVSHAQIEPPEATWSIDHADVQRALIDGTLAGCWLAPA